MNINIYDVEDWLTKEMASPDNAIMSAMLTVITKIKNGRDIYIDELRIYQSELFRRGITREQFLAYAREQLADPTK